VEVLDLRHFSSVDLRPLMQDEVQMWSRELSWDYTGSADMILRYVDSRILPGYAAVERGRIMGYSFFVYEGSKGVIGDLYIADGKELQEQRSVESRLLTHVIETLQQSPGIHRVEAQLLVHETGSVVRPFTDQGFKRHPRLFMVLPLQDGARHDTAKMKVALPPDVEIRRWSEHDYQSAAALITGAYRSHVDAEINDQYRSLSGSLRFLNNIVRFPGCGTFDPESSFVAFHKRNTLAGLILCSRVRNDVGHVTQICVLPEYRSHGIGQALLGTTVNNLQQRKFTMLSLTVTEDNAHAVKLYKHLGFETKRVFDAFVWQS
jgi:ribosomal protein S18 acetylase RimI-like enzyme